ncbi:MAG: hypothetical protein LBR64_03390 [Dysgonamonadaceae bacterium]|jgi:hypothetical protein|nr:hypothetical protein [Dysgonamonadaceae bacterium]
MKKHKNMTTQKFPKFFTLLLASALLFSCAQKEVNRLVINLNGEWQIAKTDSLPADNFSATVPVPGLVDLASPAIDADSTHYENGWYWYRRTFALPDSAFEVANLKILKARYHTKVYVNGIYAGENYFCFSPVYFDLKKYLKQGAENEIVIGVGCQPQLPDTIQNGHDYETERYIPGIYDDVQLILANKPYIRNVQCAPDIEKNSVRIVAEITANQQDSPEISYILTEKTSGKKIASGKVSCTKVKIEKSADGSEPSNYKADFEVVIKDAQLWSPEMPFLYQIELKTAADAKTTTFGMREFHFDPEKRMAVLNGKPFYLLGTNVVFQRFTQDPDRASLPWDRDWVVKLINKYKEMNWRIVRFHIGPVPDCWYEICDSLGMMVQDEFAISGKQLQPLRSALLAEEFTRWVRDRWNHPSIVIWDANNESTTLETAPAINEVRKLDLSGRVWENGWAKPAALTDPLESHPYMFLSYFVGEKPSEKGYLHDLFSLVSDDLNDANGNTPDSIPEGMKLFPNIRFINEYGWLWLNRNGSPTTLTRQVYSTLWGDSLSPQQRFYHYARNLAMLTEYWRAHRQTAGVMHFCGLGYSLPDSPVGATCDNFSDVKAVTFEPEFYKYVKPAFAPVGLMLDFWDKSNAASETIKVPLYVVNDTDSLFNQEVTLTLTKDYEVFRTTQKANAPALQVQIMNFELPLPADAGNYLLKAGITLNGEEVFCVRDVRVDSIAP